MSSLDDAIDKLIANAAALSSKAANSSAAGAEQYAAAARHLAEASAWLRVPAQDH